MKTISPALKAHLEQEVTTLCTCWKITLNNGTVLGFTDHVNNLEIDGVTYESAIGYTPSNVTTSNNLSVDNLEVIALVDSDLITEGDIIAGLWDYAGIEIFVVNYEDLSQGSLHQRKGTLGNIKLNRGAVAAELRGMMQAYTNVIGEVTTPTCRAQFGDNRCTVNLAPYTFAGAITSVTDNRNFADTSRTEADNLFQYGLVTMTSGNNAGLSMEVKASTQAGGIIELVIPFPYNLEVGDTYTIVRGCSKTFAACVGYANAINFQGEPHVPGIDRVMSYGTN